MWHLVDCNTGEVVFESSSWNECINVGLALRKLLEDGSHNLWVL